MEFIRRQSEKVKHAKAIGTWEIYKVGQYYQSISMGQSIKGNADEIEMVSGGTKEK